MIVVPYKPEHMRALVLQEAQAWASDYLNEDTMEGFDPDSTFTALDGDTVLAIGGILPIWDDRAYLWSFIGAYAAPHMISIVREVKRHLAKCPARRIESACACDFTPGHRLLRMLGFEMEAPRMRSFHPDGSDASLYARIRT